MMMTYSSTVSDDDHNFFFGDYDFLIGFRIQCIVEHVHFEITPNHLLQPLSCTIAVLWRMGSSDEMSAVVPNADIASIVDSFESL